MKNNILLSSARAQIFCENCKAVKPHDILLYYNDATKELEVHKRCICFKGEKKYQEIYTLFLVKKYNGNN